MSERDYPNERDYPQVNQRRFGTSRVVGTCLTSAVALLLALTQALDYIHCLLLASSVTALLIVWPRTLPEPPQLPDLPHHAHLGSRRDLSELSWAATDRDGRVSAKALVRVRLLANAADLDEVRDQIDRSSSPSVNQVLRWLDSIDEKVKYE